MAVTLHANNSLGFLANPVVVGDTTIVLGAGEGATFPVISPGLEQFYITVEDRSLPGALEIMLCTTRVLDSLTVLRGQQGTTVRGFAVGTSVSNRITAGFLNSFDTRLTDAGDTAEAAAVAAATSLAVATAAQADADTALAAANASTSGITAAQSTANTALAAATAAQTTANNAQTTATAASSTATAANSAASSAVSTANTAASDAASALAAANANTSAMALKANIASPTLTGIPAGPTAAPGTSTTQLATTAFVTAAVAAGGGGGGGGDANLNSPAFTGVPTAPTAPSGTNTNQIATTAFVTTAVASVGAGLAPLASPALTGTPTAPTAAPGTSSTQIATTAFVTTADALKAPIASPTFTGTPLAPTAAPGTSTTQLATTAFVTAAVGVGDPTKAPLASPALTGIPTAPTAGQGTSSTQIATTAFVTTGLALKAPIANPAFTGTPTAPTATAGTSTTQLATTAFVTTGLALKADIASPTFTGTPAGPTAPPLTNSTQLATTAFVQTAMTGSPVFPATAAQMWVQPNGFYIVTPQAIRESWVTQTLPVSGATMTLDGSTFQSGLATIAGSDLDVVGVSGMTPEPVFVSVLGSGGVTRTFTASAFDNQGNVGTTGIPVPSGVMATFRCWGDGTGTDFIHFMGYSDRGWVPAADARLAFDANKLPVTLTAAQEAAAIIATSTFKAKNVVVFELALSPDYTSDVTVGDGKDYFTIPAAINGWKCTRFQTTLVTAGTGSTMDTQLANKTSAVDVCSTKSVIASGATVGAVGVINASNNTATTDHVWRVDVDQRHTTPGKGGTAIAEFTEP